MKKSILTSAMALVLTLGACSENKTAEQLIISGNDFVQVKDYSRAIIDFKNAVRIEPKNPSARFALASAYLTQGSFLNAEKELTRALELGAEFSNTAASLAKIKTRLEKFDEVIELVKQSDDLADDDYIQVLTYAGISSFGLQKMAQGQDYLAQAVAINGNTVYGQIAQAYIYYAEQNFSDGLVIINNLLNDHEKTSEALLIQGHLYNALKEFEHASNAFSRYLTYQPEDHKIRFFEVNSLIKAGKFEQASALTDTLLQLFKDSPLALQFKAQLVYQGKDYKEARSYADQSLQHEPELLVAKIISGLSSYFLGDIEQAHTRLNSIEKRLGSAHPAHKVLAVTKFQLGYYSAAAENFASLEGLTVADVDLLQKSTANLINVGEFEGALAVINKAEGLSPNNAELIAQKGLVQLAQNDISGIESLEHAIKLDSSLTDAQLTLAVEYLKADQNDKAQKIANELQQGEKQEYLGHLLQGIIYVKEQKEIQAIASFKQALVLQPDNIASLYNLGLINQNANKVELAFDYFKQVLALSSQHKGALKSLVGLAGTENIRAQVIELLTADHDNKNYYSTIALVQSLRADNNVEAAVDNLESLDKSVGLSANYYLILGDSYLQLSQVDKANKAFAQGLAVEEKHYFLNIRYIGTLEGIGDYQAALEQARKASEYHTDDERLAILLTYLEAKNNNLIQAKVMVSKLKDKKISHHLIDSVIGEIALYEEEYSIAVGAFSTAYELEPSQLNLISLARALKFSGKANEAERVLELYIENHPENEQVRLMLANLYNVDDRDKKIVQYLSLSKSSPDNAVIFNNLAWNQYKIGKIKAALKNIEKANELAGESLAIQESYGVILVANNELVRGISVLEGALDIGSVSKEVKSSLEKAMTLIKQGGSK